MNKLVLFLMIGLSYNISTADDSLSESCKQQLRQDMLSIGNGVLGSSLTEANIDSQMWLNTKKNKLNLNITGKEDGVHFSFEAIVTDSDIVSCNIQPKLILESSCRYSNYGEKNLDEINNIVFGETQIITNDKNLTPIQKSQIENLLIYGNKNTSLNDMIAETDDGEVLLSLITLPDGKKLDYYKTYGGDNPYGVFYYQGTLDVAGTNSDDSICIAFPN